MQTYVGAGPDTKLRRFLVGPVECEITGLAESPDGRALFVNIQHPGEETAAANVGNPALFSSHWPDGGTSPSAVSDDRHHAQRWRRDRRVETSTCVCLGSGGESPRFFVDASGGESRSAAAVGRARAASLSAGARERAAVPRIHA